MEYLITVIILNYNGRKYLPNLFKTLKKQILSDIEVIIVDNSSTDGSHKLAAKFSKDNLNVTFIKLRKNLGFSGANNFASKKAEGTYLLFLNNDVALPKNFVKDIRGLALKYGEKYIISPIQLRFSKKQFFFAGGRSSFWGFCWNYKKDSVVNNEILTQISSFGNGAALLIKKDIFNKLKGFDLNFYSYFEDIDLCWRSLAHGIHTITPKSCFLYHRGSGSWSSGKKTYSNHKKYLYVRNAMITVSKCFRGSHKMVSLALWHFFIICYAISRFYLPRTAFSLLKAIRDFYLFSRLYKGKMNPKLDKNFISLHKNFGLEGIFQEVYNV